MTPLDAPGDPPEHAPDDPERDAGGPRTLVLGVLGGIASGKSAVARLLAGPGGVVLDADRAAHEALESPEVRALLVAQFGEEVLAPPAPGSGPDAEPTVDRAALARVVFDRPEARKLLEGWIHPRVRARLRASLDDAHRRHVPRVVLDVPLLLENADEHGLLEPCDFLVYVETPPDARDARAVRDRGWAPGEVARREATQMPQTAKRARADVVIQNDGDLDALADATERALRTLLAR